MGKNTGFFSDLDCYLFGEGTHYEIYEKLGAHPKELDGKKGMYFSVWAPHAAAVHVVGDYNHWDTDASPMVSVQESGVFETFLPDFPLGGMYKYAITTQDGKLLYKADPYAFHAEYRPGTASITADLSGFKWSDDKWMEKRLRENRQESPMSIYEVHLGSWKRHLNAENENAYYNYREAAKELAVYVKNMGYTHVELIGIAEHPFDGSWGYQVTGYYAPTSRYGTPDDFMYFVNHLHKNGIGVILDWVPAHFPRDAHGLADFDGTPTYEYADPRKGEHPDWGTKIFDYGKHEVSNFLIANALYWADKYHIDGLRVDAVASMLYLDYGKEAGQWVPNKFGGHENLEAIEFFRHLNSVMKRRSPGVMVIAEESTAWPKVTDAPEDGGLGFTFKWNMGWMHDFLEYMKLDPLFRKGHHHQMTFGLTYFTSENFVLVLSHDEVVHLKRSMLGKMPGEYDEKFACLKAGYTFMIGHPGKKLLFMGQDFGQWKEWNEETELEWYLIKEEKNADLQKYVRGLLHLYRKYSACYVMDSDWNGFEWMNCNDSERSIFSFIRKSKNGKNNLLFICNFTPVARPNYRVGVPRRGKYTLLLDETRGLHEKSDPKDVYTAQKRDCDGKQYSIAYPLPGYGTAVFKF
ncbi:1,4-alpha-glucan branching protein GlgB [Lachnotalea sp. AF33-28]|uniref:1,4-alpha-glucan branching protein GlgB n=1 Tax=Lachnotalea sp. AF33-28 TaxID=2292046 RepID=UPI000E52F954|nr:1,4-alpha-glucan branching protein GlgB [Lachnotalea sp. AF33-28]RHP30698.1 1,4-alpha-glucan branching protein GlgB [Lachnotalea sp. AF33-28]